MDTQLEPPVDRELGSRLLRFSTRIVRRFQHHHGLLLASAIAYNTLLSLVPLLSLALIILSHFVDADSIRSFLAPQLAIFSPEAVRAFERGYDAFVAKRGAAGIYGVAGLAVFSAFSFRAVSEAVGVIFESPPIKTRPGRVAVALVPLAYVACIGAGILLGTLLMVFAEALVAMPNQLFGLSVSAAVASAALLKVIGFGALVALLASFYGVLPRWKVRPRHAWLGGLAAACLWEVVRRILVWYFKNVSLVGLVYGSLASTVVLLLSFETAAIVLLLCGQVIAEVTRSTRAGLPWYEEPESEPSSNRSQAS